VERTPVIHVDVHEPRVIAEQLQGLGAAVVRHSLPTGDYLTDEVIIERKTVRDLHLTLVSGRLWDQLGRMRATGRRPYLLLEGPSLDDGPLAPAAVRGALLASIDQGIPVLRSESQADSVLWIVRVAVRAGRTRPAPNRPAYAQRPKSAGPATAAEAALASIPSISTRCARTLLKHFGSVAAVADASPDRLLEVPGIGGYRAAKIAETLNGSHSPYRSRQSRERQDPST
jgi:ERCC4-type nuclease